MPVTARQNTARRAQAQQRPAVEGNRPAKLSAAALDVNADRRASAQPAHDDHGATTPHRPSIGTPHRGVNVIRAADRLAAHPNANVHYELQKRTQYIPGQLQHEFEALANAAIVIQQQMQQQPPAGMNTLMTWQDQYTIPAAMQQEVWIPVQEQQQYADYAYSDSMPTPTASGGYPTPSHFNANAKPFYPRWERHEYFRHEAQRQHALDEGIREAHDAQSAPRMNRAAVPARQGRETRAASRERAPSPGPVSHIKVVTRANARTAQQRQAPIVSMRPQHAQQQFSPQRQAIIEAPSRKPVKVDPAMAAKTRAAAAMEREYGRHLAMESERADGPVVVGIRTSGIARLAESGSGSYGTFTEDTTSSRNKKVAKKQKAAKKGAKAAASRPAHGATYPKFSPMEYRAMYKMIAVEAALEGKRRMLAAAARALTGDRRPALAAAAARGLARPLGAAAKKAAPTQQKQQKLSPAAYRALYKTVAREAARVGAARMAAAERGERDVLARRHALDHRRNAITRATFEEHLRQGPAATSMMMGGLRALPIRELYRNLAAEAAEIGAMRSAAWGDARRVMLGTQRGYAAPTAASLARQRAAPPQPTQGATRGREHRRQSSVVVVAPRTVRHAHSPYPYVQDTEMEHRTMLQAAELDERDRLLHSAVGTATTRRAALQRVREARGRALAERQAERHRARLAAARSASEMEKFEARRVSREERQRPWRRADWATDMVKRHHGGTPLTSYIDLRRTGAIASPISSSADAENFEVARTRLPIDLKPMNVVGMHRAAVAAMKAAGGMTPLQRRREVQRSRATPKKRSAAGMEEHLHAAARRVDPYHLACSERDEHFHAALLKTAHSLDNGPRMHSEGEAKLRAQNPHLDPNIAHATTRTTAAMQGRAQALGGQKQTLAGKKKKTMMTQAGNAKRRLFEYHDALGAMRAGDEPYLRLTRRGPAPNAPYPHTFHFEDGVYWNLSGEALRQRREVDQVLAAAAANVDRVDPLLAATKATINTEEDDVERVVECDACCRALACARTEAQQREVLARTPLRFKNNARHCRPRSNFHILVSKN